MKSIIRTFFLFLLISGCSETVEPPVEITQHYEIRGADLSFLPEMESASVQFSDSAGAGNLLVLLKKHGFNSVRLRIWNNPPTGRSGLNEVLELSKRVTAAGLNVWLDFHYSDTWADPGNQKPPVAWAGLTGSVLEDSLYQFTHHSLIRFRDAGVHPTIIQIGNEINVGFLWPAGAVTGSDTVSWNRFRGLLSAGLSAGTTVFPEAQKMIHIAGLDAGFWFFGNLEQKPLDFDLIGVSFYPWWHGRDLQWAEITLGQLFRVTGKPVIIAETAYPFTLGWNDWTNNMIGDSSQCHPDFPPTPVGQSAFLKRMKHLASSPEGMAFYGVCYWAPDWVAAYGPQATNGSSWENLALFDFKGKALPGFYELGKP